MKDSYPFQYHPCWSEDRAHVWERIHLPVAAACNIKCAFCNHSSGVSCHIPRPGSARRVMSAQKAIETANTELDRRPNLRVVAIAGPGEPLANTATYEVLSELRNSRPGIHFCLSTNGVLLGDVVDRLVESGVDTLSVSMSAGVATTAKQVYEWAILHGRRVTGEELGRSIVRLQLNGIRQASDAGIHVKVNSVLIPGVNDSEVASLSESISCAGAELQNIIPLVPCGTMSMYKPPTPLDLERARAKGRKHIRQFCNCHQCRADVVGIPGADVNL